MVARLSLLALALSLFCQLVDARAVISKRDRITEEDNDVFLLERRNPSFSCRWATNPSTNERSFQCPAPCRLRDVRQTPNGEPLRPRDWQCPPSVRGAAPTDTLCEWKRNGRLACPANCGWEETAEGSHRWSCVSQSLLRSQSQRSRQQFLLGWKAGAIDKSELEVRSKYLCPGTELACPLRFGMNIGTTLVPSGSFECINAQESLEHCGGCSTVPSSGGRNCNELLNAHAACVAGTCEIMHCRNGAVLNSEGTACVMMTAHATSL